MTMIFSFFLNLFYGPNLYSFLKTKYQGQNFKNNIQTNYKEFNLRYNSDDSTKLYTCFKINDDLWYLYDINLRLIRTSKEKINNMLSNGWVTVSRTLEDELATELDSNQLK